MVQTCGLTQFPPFPILSSFSTYLAFAFSLSPPFPLSQEVIPSHGTSKMRVNIQHIVAQKTNTHKKRTTLDSISPIFSLKLANPSAPLLGRPDIQLSRPSFRWTFTKRSSLTPPQPWREKRRLLWRLWRLLQLSPPSALRF